MLITNNLFVGNIILFVGEFKIFFTTLKKNQYNRRADETIKQPKPQMHIIQ